QGRSLIVSLGSGERARQLTARRDVQLGEDVTEVILDRLGTDVETDRYLAIGKPFSDQVGNAEFCRSEAGVFVDARQDGFSARGALVVACWDIGCCAECSQLGVGPPKLADGIATPAHASEHPAVGKENASASVWHRVRGVDAGVVLLCCLQEVARGFGE